jgi:hypothetical protein
MPSGKNVGLVGYADDFDTEEMAGYKLVSEEGHQTCFRGRTSNLFSRKDLLFTVMTLYSLLNQFLKIGKEKKKEYIRVLYRICIRILHRLMQSQLN